MNDLTMSTIPIATPNATTSKVPLLPNILKDESTPFVLYRSHRGQYIRQRNALTGLAGPWPNSTTLWCRHCVHSFDSVPIPIPASWDANRAMYRVYGNYCSFSCALGWLRDRCFPDVAYQKTLLFHMARHVFQYEQKIFPAPPQHQLIVFGGPLDIIAFRMASKPLDSDESGIVRMISRETPFIPYHIAVEEHVQNPLSLNPNTNSNANRKKKTNTASEDIQLNGTYILASGKVPEGGLFHEFLHQQLSASASSSTNPNTNPNNVKKTNATAQRRRNANPNANANNNIIGPITFDSVVNFFASASAAATAASSSTATASAASNNIRKRKTTTTATTTTTNAAKKKKTV